MECKACKKTVKTKDFMKCRLCLGKYHRECLAIEVKQFRAYTEEYKSTWVCLICTNVTRRARSTDNTPVRRNDLPVGSEDQMNMSCDIEYDQSTSNVSPTLSLAAAPTGISEAITLESISALLDRKLKTSLLDFKESIRKALREDIKEMVKSEIEAAIRLVKDDFSVTTDFICDEQKTLRTDINKNSETIKHLEREKAQLQSELDRLNARLTGIEKISRSCNIEIQAVPERKNENLVGLLKKLCNTVKFNLDDGQISACRRVAKYNSSSSRPRNIVVTFATPRIRDSVLSACHRYKKACPGRGLTSVDLDIPGETRKVFVTEHLSLEQKTLHAATRQAAKERGYKYVWIRYGQIYVRKEDSAGAILIKDIESLSKLTST